jgi:hypothetical protein
MPCVAGTSSSWRRRIGRLRRTEHHGYEVGALGVWDDGILTFTDPPHEGNYDHT